MEVNIKKLDFKKILLLINDILILIINIILCIFLFIISNKEKIYRGSSKLFIFQIIIIIVIILLDILLNLKNLLNNYKGHNRYGMLIRFLMFYSLLFCVVLSCQRTHNLNHSDIRDLGDIFLYIGLTNNGLLIVSMIISFFVIDMQKEEKILVYKNRKSINMYSVENANLLEDSHSSNQVIKE